MVHLPLSSCVRSWRVLILALLMVSGGEMWLAVALPSEAVARGRGGKRGQTRGRGRHVRPAATTGKGVGGTTGFANLPGEKSFNECRKYPYYKRIKVTLKPDSELHDLVAWISGMTCKRFIVTGKLRAPKVTIVSPTSITPREAYRAFLSALNAMGLTVQPAGRYLKIIELTGVARQPVLTCAAGKRCPRDERAVTQMFRLKHVEPDDVSTVLQQLTKGSIVTYGATNLLIITDTGANIGRLRKIIRELDQPAQAEKIWFIKVRHALASDVAEMALKVFPGAGDGAKSRSSGRTTRRRYQRRGRRRKAAPRTSTVVKVKGSRGDPSVSKIIAEERNNALVVVADDRGYLQVAAFVKRIDIRKAGGEGRLHIVKLQNADAVELAATLSGLTRGGASGGRTSRSTRRGRSRSRARKTSKSGGGMVSLFDGEVQITESKATNALLIVASTRDYLSLRRVIKELDMPRRQVFVEATILEVSLSKQRDLGMSWHGGTTVGKGDKKTIMTFGNNAAKTIQPAAVLLDPASLMGMAASLSGPEIKGAAELLGVPGLSLPSFGVFFQALQSNDDVNLVSAPHILATDNEEAVISVGENVPFQSAVAGVPTLNTGTTGTPGVSLGGMQSIQREDVALTLKITPYVNDSGYVRMKIEQELEEVKSIDPVTGPTVVKRKVKTMVTVRDQQTVVIGGLITNKIKKFVQKVPILGDIPILGYLFKNTVKIVEKTNLLIFLTPYVVRDQSDLRRIFQRKIQQRREFIERFTAFKNVDYEAVVDFSHKRGLIAEIDRVTRSSEQEARMRAKALEASRDRFKEGLLRAVPRPPKPIRRKR